jgi:hypothetical protein
MAFRARFENTPNQGTSMKSKTPYNLSIIIAVLGVITSAGGLLLNDLYRDNLFVTSAWKGNDLITLFIAVPILIIAMIYSKRGSHKAQLIWMGVLDYMLYNYALLGLSIFALIFGLIDLDINGITGQVRERMPVGWIAAYMLFVAIGLSLIYIAQSLGFIFTGEVPAIVTNTGHPTNIVFALDLTLLVPFLFLGAIWLIKRNSWGYVLAGISTVKGPLYTIVLTAGSLWAANAGVPGVAEQVPLWIVLTVLGLIACGLFYGNMKRKA